MTGDFKGLIHEIRGYLEENTPYYSGFYESSPEEQAEHTRLTTKLDAFLEAVGVEALRKALDTPYATFDEDHDNYGYHLVGAVEHRRYMRAAQLLSTITEKEECR